MSVGRTTTQDKILVLSLDFDGCIFNDNYLTSTAPDRLTATNQPLFDHIINTINNGHYARVIFMVGSNRQSKKIDDNNAATQRKINDRYYQSESCFPALKKICQFIQSKTTVTCEVDGYLLADTAGNKPAGENFENACLCIPIQDYAYSKTRFSDDTSGNSFKLVDEKKILLLYAQMHKNASRFPDAKIDFCFYDDRSDITETLTHFYQYHLPDYIPRTTELKLHLYSGNKVTEDMKLKANSGAIDNDYQTNLRLLATISNSHPKELMLSGNEAIKFDFLTRRTLNLLDKYDQFSSYLINLKQSDKQSNHAINQCIDSLETVSTMLQTLTKKTPSNHDTSKILDDLIRVSLALLLYQPKETYEDSDRLQESANMKRLIMDFISAYKVTRALDVRQTTSSFIIFPAANQPSLANKLNDIALALEAYFEPSLEAKPNYIYS